MLRQEMGDDLFFITLRRLIQKYADSWLSLDDFRNAFLEAAPSQTKLKQFFTQWLDRDEAPIYDTDWSDVGNGSNHKVKVVIRQRENNGDPFQLRLEVAVDSKEGSRLHTVEINSRETSTILDSMGVPTGIRLDPYRRLFIWKKEYGR